MAEGAQKHALLVLVIAEEIEVWRRGEEGHFRQKHALLVLVIAEEIEVWRRGEEGHFRHFNLH